MIKRWWPSWGIAARLLAVAVLPASIMFLAVTATLYVTAQADVRRDVAERGRLIATALAQSSQYGLVSGNVAYLHTTLRRLVQADPSIACVDITDAARRLVVSECRDTKPAESSAHEVPVHIESQPNLDWFEPSPAPQSGRREVRTVGHVRVTMSPAPLFEAKRHALLVACALVLGAAVLSCLVGVILARRLRKTFASVMAALRDIRRGQFDVLLDTTRPDELGELQKAIVQMAGTLHVARHDLEEQVATRTQALQEAVTLARQADAEKRRLIVHSNALVEEERRRIAMDLHDHLGASLISVRLEASALLTKAEAQGHAGLAQDARRIATTAEAIYTSTRHIVKSLRPEVIDMLGLTGAIEELVRHFDEVHPDCRFAFEAEADLPDLRGEQAMPAYRVAQEALTNIVKHAGASRVSVSLAAKPDAAHLRMVIEDNGRGFDTRAIDHPGMGLIGMRERVEAVGGALALSSTPGRGTRVQITLPMRPA
ncbi:MAG: HAMP domain-containing protein [Rubrivivax sp.]|nr:MAG: HAMP domain-containing protein [Rubrivivax sp.]